VSGRSRSVSCTEAGHGYGAVVVVVVVVVEPVNKVVRRRKRAGDKTRGEIGKRKEHWQTTTTTTRFGSRQRETVASKARGTGTGSNQLGTADMAIHLRRPGYNHCYRCQRLEFYSLHPLLRIPLRRSRSRGQRPYHIMAAVDAPESSKTAQRRQRRLQADLSLANTS
jgi:hypothetical protein